MSGNVRTNSIWERDTKWVIMAACSQLNYGNQGNGVIWDNSTASQIWARTLLGNKYRAHGILGYFESAPGDTDEQIIQDFLELADPSSVLTPDSCIVDSWKYANEWNMGLSGTNWAAIYHTQNASDYMNNIGPSTVRVSNPTIHRRSRKSVVSWDDVITLPLSRNTLFSSSFEGQKYSLDNTVEIVSLDNKEFVFQRSKQQNQVKRIILQDNQQRKINYNQIAEKLLGTNIRNNSTKEFDYYKNDNKFLQVFNNGRIEFRDLNIEKSIEEKIDATPDEMVYKAKEFLKTLDLLPDKDYEIDISTVGRNILYDDGQPVKEETSEIVEYNIIWLQKHNDIPIVSDKGEGISVRMNNNGVTNFKYSWRNVDELITEQKIIEPKEAMDEYIKNYNKLFKTSNEEERHFADLSLMYYYKDGEVIPVWAFKFGEVGNISLIDAVKGSKLR